MVKRIAMLTDNADPLVPLGSIEAGGENVYILELSRVLGRLGWTVDVFVRWSYPKTAQIARIAENVRVIRLPAGPIQFISKDELFPYMRSYIDAFFEFTKKSHLEYLLIHGNYYFSGWAGVQIAKKLGIPYVNTFHTLGVVKHRAMGAADPSPKDRFKLEQEVMTGCTKIIATSPPMKDDLMELYKVPAKKIAVISAGVNLNRFVSVPQLLARKVLHMEQNLLNILYVGRLEERKGVETLLRAVGLLVQNIPNKRPLLHVSICGGEAKQRWQKASRTEQVERKRLMDLIDELNISDIVHWYGAIDREMIPYYYSAADVTVVPSYYEPFGLVPLESMASGTPVIASRTGGLQWTIKDGKTGYLFPVRDYKALADKIQYLILHALVRKRLRENGLERAKHMFGWDMVGWHMSGFYNDLIIEYLFRKYVTKNPNGNGNGNGKS